MLRIGVFKCKNETPHALQSSTTLKPIRFPTKLGTIGWTLHWIEGHVGSHSWSQPITVPPLHSGTVCNRYHGETIGNGVVSVWAATSQISSHSLSFVA